MNIFRQILGTKQVIRAKRGRCRLLRRRPLKSSPRLRVPGLGAQGMPPGLSHGLGFRI